LDFQYFAAGLAPAIIVAVFGAVGFALRALGEWRNTTLSDKSRKWGQVLRVISTLGIVLSASALFFTKIIPELVIGISFVSSMLLSGVAAFLSREASDRTDQRFFLIMAWIYVPLIPLVSLPIYVLLAFPHVPQALGGPRPESVQLDFEISKLSPTTAQTILPPNDRMATNSGVVRSRTLYLVLQTSDYLVIQSSANTWPTNPVFRLKRDAVQGVFPVE